VLPNVVIETLLVATPVIATKVSGVPELIEDGSVCL
jgi:glycosyltransferase involved in cell wall biosynthesis